MSRSTSVTSRENGALHEMLTLFEMPITSGSTLSSVTDDRVPDK